MSVETGQFDVLQQLAKHHGSESMYWSACRNLHGILPAVPEPHELASYSTSLRTTNVGRQRLQSFCDSIRPRIYGSTSIRALCLRPTPTLQCIRLGAGPSYRGVRCRPYARDQLLRDAVRVLSANMGSSGLQRGENRNSQCHGAWLYYQDPLPRSVFNERTTSHRREGSDVE
jgi:hypothetical protein